MKTEIKYLEISFESARVFYPFYRKNGKTFKTKDFVNDIEGKKSRADMPYYKEPITANQVSNVIHVLFGERPKPSLRSSFIKRNDYYFNKAQESFLKIDTRTEIDQDGNVRYPKEITHLQKTVKNSWNNNPTINWEIVRRYTDTHFEWLRSELSKHLNDSIFSQPFYEVRKQIVANKSLLATLKDELQKREIYGLFTYICDDKKSSDMTRNKRITLTVNRGIDYISTLSGTIMVPVTHEDLERLSEVSKGVCTILDGGIAKIKSLRSASFFNSEEEGFIPVKNISCETKKLLTNENTN